jgi:hypothetical protein
VRHVAPGEATVLPRSPEALSLVYVTNYNQIKPKSRSGGLAVVVPLEVGGLGFVLPSPWFAWCLFFNFSLIDDMAG